MTASESVTLRVVDALIGLRVAYLLSGSFASNFYGIPRSTKDADFVIQHSGGVGSEFAKQLGADFELDPQLSFEPVTGTYKQVARHCASSFKIEFFMLSQDPHDQARFARRREQSVFGRNVWLLSPEDTIVSKLRWARNKDEDDVRNVISVQHSKLDWQYVEKWCREHGTLTLLTKIRGSVPDI